MSVRIEHDTFGEIEVPGDKFWGAQTERSKRNFPVGKERMPIEVVYGFAQLKRGAALANHELLAILLRTGTREMNVLQLSMKVLSEFDNLFMLRHVTVEELVSIEGIGNAKAIEMIAAIEFGNRVARASQIKEGTVTSSSFVGALLQEELGGLQQEHVMALHLNTKNEIIKKEIVLCKAERRRKYQSN